MIARCERIAGKKARRGGKIGIVKRTQILSEQPDLSELRRRRRNCVGGLRKFNQSRPVWATAVLAEGHRRFLDRVLGKRRMRGKSFAGHVDIHVATRRKPIPVFFLEADIQLNRAVQILHRNEVG